ncbi:MAG: DUF3105 domain-containing protein [Myxococcales bacterium]
MNHPRDRATIVEMYLAVGRACSASSLIAWVVMGSACAGDGKHAHESPHDNDSSDEAGIGSDAGEEPAEVDAAPSGADAGGDVEDAAASEDAGDEDAGEEARLSPCSVCTTCEHAVPLPATANHIEGNIDYTDPPPAGGDHNPCWLNFGVYDQERPDERWVHNLEHGGVVFLYHCPKGCPAELAELKKLTVGKEQVLLTPYAALPTKFAAVSWGYRLLTNCFNTKQFAGFYATHVDHGPESIKYGPPSAYCPP